MGMIKTQVLHVTTAHRANDIRIFERECKSLSSNGYRVVLAAPGPWVGSEGITWLALPQPSTSQFRRVLRSQFTLLNLFRKIRAEIVHVHDPEALPICILMSLITRQKFIWDAHEDYFLQYKRYRIRTRSSNLSSFVKQIVINIFLNATSRTFDQVIGATEEICSKYDSNFVTCIGNEAKVDEFKSCTPNFKNINLLFTGAIGGSNCFVEVVKAVELLPNLNLILATRDSNTQILEWANHVLGERFHHKGWVPHNLLKEIIANSALGFVTYHDSETNSTNSPNKFFEFAAAGLPVVCTPNPSLLNLVAMAKNGVIASSFDEVGLKNAITTALNSRKIWESMSESGKTWASVNGNWKLSEKKLLDIYSRLKSKH